MLKDRTRDFGADNFLLLISDLRRDLPTKINFYFINGRMKNSLISRELMILLDPLTDYKTASIEYYPKSNGAGKTVLSPKIYPTRAIGKILKYVSSREVKAINRNKIRSSLSITYEKVGASLLCLWYLGYLFPIPGTAGEFYPTEKNSDFSFVKCPEYIFVKKYQSF